MNISRVNVRKNLCVVDRLRLRKANLRATAGRQAHPTFDRGICALALETLVSVGRPTSPIAVGVTAILLIVGIVFSTITISITDEHVEWWFTLGILRQKLALSQIEFAISEKVTLVNGLGVRTNGRNWLWIVNGSSVVSFNLKDG